MIPVSLQRHDQFKTQVAAQRSRFVAEAKAARKAMRKSGTGYDADEVHAYLRQRVTGREAAAPQIKPWLR